MSKVTKILNKISSIKDEIYNYIINTEHWLIYWINADVVQEFIGAYPEDYEDRVSLSILEFNEISVTIAIHFVEHPSAVKSIRRYIGLATFRDEVKANWEEWGSHLNKSLAETKEEELEYYKGKVAEIEEELKKLKNK